MEGWKPSDADGLPSARLWGEPFKWHKEGRSFCPGGGLGCLVDEVGF